MPHTRLFRLIASAVFIACLPKMSQAHGEVLPESMVGIWNVSPSACLKEITPTWLEVRPQNLGFFYGLADVAEIKRTGPVIFLRGKLHQEGQVNPEALTEFYRLEQRSGRDRLRFNVKGQKPIDLVRCETGIVSALPLQSGVYVAEGSTCSSPANAEFRVLQNGGLSGSATRECRPNAISMKGDEYTFEQSCVDTYTGKRKSSTQVLTIRNDDRFTSKKGPTFRRCSPDKLPDFLWDHPVK